MSRKIAFFPLLCVALCLSSVAADEFPDADIRWILDKYNVSQPQSLIAAEGLVGWTKPGGREIAAPSKWSNKEGKLTLEFSDRTRDFQGGDIVTSKQYTNFVLDFAWIASKGINNGIKYRVKDFGETRARLAKGWLGCEYQILDENAGSFGKGSTGSLYQLFAPDKETKKLHPFGERNTGRVIVLDNHIEHWLNGKKVMQCEVGSDAWKQAVADSKFKRDDGTSFGFGENPTGYLMITDHGGTIIYDKIVVREIGEKR